MSEVRENQSILFIGIQNCGKTTLALEVAKATGKKIIVINKGRFPDNYNNWQQVTIDGLKNFDGDKCVVQIQMDEVNLVCEVLLKYVYNAFVIFEDCKRYIPQQIAKGGLYDLICDLRKNDIDVAYMYHLLKYVPPVLADNYKMLFLFKTTDTLSRKYLDKFPNTETLIKKGLQIQKHKNPHHSECIFYYE